MACWRLGRRANRCQRMWRGLPKLGRGLCRRLHARCWHPTIAAAGVPSSANRPDTCPRAGQWQLLRGPERKTGTKHRERDPRAVSLPKQQLTQHPAKTLDKQARSEDFREYRRSSFTREIHRSRNFYNFKRTASVASLLLRSCRVASSSDIRFCKAFCSTTLCALEAACLNKAWPVQLRKATLSSPRGPLGLAAGRGRGQAETTQRSQEARELLRQKRRRRTTSRST